MSVSDDMSDMITKLANMLNRFLIWYIIRAKIISLVKCLIVETLACYMRIEKEDIN